MAPLLTVEDLSVRIPTARGVVHPVNGVSFTVARGQVVGIIGETGSGKSTVARALLGLTPHPGYVAGGSAQIELDGRSIDLIHAGRELRGSVIGFVPQSTSGALNPVISLERQFETVLRAHHRIGRAECRERALDVLQRVGIRDPSGVLGGYAHQLSGGMAQRVVMAMVLCLEPALIVADEPTTGLDVTVQKQLLDELLSLATGSGNSLLLISHGLGVVAQYCQRMVVLYGGYVLEEGPVREVLRSPAHPYTRALLDSIPAEGKELRALAGAVGDLLTLPPGCPFFDRCPDRSDARCATELPPLREVGAGHRARTWCSVRGAA